jgi:hypothetical protein
MTSGLGLEIRFVDIEPRGVVPCRTSYLATARGLRIDMAHVPANACSLPPAQRNCRLAQCRTRDTVMGLDRQLQVDVHQHDSLCLQPSFLAQ